MNIIQLLDYLYNLRQEFLANFDEALAHDDAVMPPSRARLDLVEQLTLVEVLRAERAKYPTPMSQEQKGAMLNDACAKVGGPWGLLLKPSGNNCPCQGTAIACDIVFNRDTKLHYDVLRDAEGAAEVVWAEVGPMDVNRWLAPKVPAGGSVPGNPPPNNPPPTNNDLAAIVAMLVDVRTMLQTQASDIVFLKNRPIADLQVLLSSLTQIDASVQAAEKAARAPRPVEIRAGVLGTVRGTIGAPTF